LVEQGSEIFHPAKVGFDDAALALDGRLLDLQVGEGLRLDREPVGEAVNAPTVGAKKKVSKYNPSPEM
jgi:hypothetical protein